MRNPLLAALAALAALEPGIALAGRIVAIPEPGSIGLFAAGIGAAAIVLRLWRRK